MQSIRNVTDRENVAFKISACNAYAPIHTPQIKNEADLQTYIFYSKINNIFKRHSYPIIDAPKQFLPEKVHNTWTYLNSKKK